MELLFNGYKFHLGKIKMFWRCMVVTVAQQCQCIDNALTIHLKMVKMVNFRMYISSQFKRLKSKIEKEK